MRDKRFFGYILATIVCLTGFSFSANAQFKEEAFTQNYNPADSTAQTDTSDKMFSFKELFRGVAHKQDLKIGTMFAGSVMMPGLAQIYNKDYWKLPIVYGGIGACAGIGGFYLHKYNVSKKNYENALSMIPPNATDIVISPGIDYDAKRKGTWFMVGAGLIYWGTLMDGVVNYKKDEHPHPGRATLYSILLPGLGQAYNGEYWKIPIYYGCLLGSVHYLYTNNINYQRFKRIHNEATNPDIEYTGSISGETAKWYRDVYRRYRDYSIVATALFYLLQVIDANVFAYMHDFEVNDDITMKVEPAVIAPDNAYAMQPTMNFGATGNAIGFRLGIRF